MGKTQKEADNETAAEIDALADLAAVKAYLKKMHAKERTSP